ncbi:MAG: serine hydrolase domain-containing protein [Vulcanimicrobiaceae bacterium]
MTKHDTMHAAALLLALLPAVSAGAFPSNDVARMDRVVRYVMRDRAIAGCAIGVRRGDDGAHYERAYGFADPSHTRPVRIETVFAIGSLSKTILAAATLRLARGGGIDLDAPALTYLPQSGIGAATTVRELLNQTAGLPDYSQRADFDRFSREPVAPETLLARALSAPVDFAPGTDWAYSNTNYLALGLAVAAATRRPLPAWLGGDAFAPLGMRSTNVWSPGTFEPGRASGNVPWGTPSLAFASGDLESNVPDMERFAAALYGGGSWSLLAAMMRPTVLPDGTLVPYGMGLSTARPFGFDTGLQSGFINGFSSLLAFVPSRKLVAVALCNADEVDLVPLAKSLIAAALEVDEAHPERSAP